MAQKVVVGKRVESKPLYLRTLTRSGGTRYLSIGAILPPDWERVKVLVEVQSKEVYVLRLERIS